MGSEEQSVNHTDPAGRGRADLLVIAILALVVAYVTAAAATGNSRPFILVTGASMEPTYHAGDLLVVSKVAPASVGDGDVIVFHTPRSSDSSNLPSRIAHRVVETEGLDGMVAFRTRGDNSDRDPFVVPSNRLIGRVSINLGPLGRPLLWIGNLKFLLLLGAPLLIGGAAYWLLMRGEEEEGPGGHDTADRAERALSHEGVPGGAVPQEPVTRSASFVDNASRRQRIAAAGRVAGWVGTDDRLPGHVRGLFDEVLRRTTRERGRDGHAP